MNLLQKFEQSNIAGLLASNTHIEFAPGDTLKVHVTITEPGAADSRTQVYEGLCIAKVSRGIASNFTVRKISYGYGVERQFPLYSPRITKIELVKRGKVRRAKLYYMRALRGKATRLSEIRTDKPVNTPTEEAAV